MNLATLLLLLLQAAPNTVAAAPGTAATRPAAVTSSAVAPAGAVSASPVSALLQMPTGPLTPKQRVIATYAMSRNPILDAGTAAVLAQTIDTTATAAQIDPLLVTALISFESGFRPDARSSSGALGLGQLLPSTATALGVSDPLDPLANIRGTVALLAQLYTTWNEAGDAKDQLVLASYRVGPRNVQLCGGVPDRDDIKTFIQNVLQLRDDLAKQ